MDGILSGMKGIRNAMFCSKLGNVGRGLGMGTSQDHDNGQKLRRNIFWNGYVGAGCGDWRFFVTGKIGFWVSARKFLLKLEKTKSRWVKMKLFRQKNSARGSRWANYLKFGFQTPKSNLKLHKNI